MFAERVGERDRERVGERDSTHAWRVQRLVELDMEITTCKMNVPCQLMRSKFEFLETDRLAVALQEYLID